MAEIICEAVKQKRLKEITMQAGILQYTLDELPDENYAISCFINGVEVSFFRDGVNITVTEYSAGSIEDSWIMKIYYFI